MNNYKSKRSLRKKKITFQDTTILINIKDQEYFSKKLINYLNFQNIEIKILIADGGKKKQNKIFKKLKQKYQYKYHGYDKDMLTFFKKILSAIGSINTKYVFFCDQDDYVNFECLKKQENFLNENSDFSLCLGTCYNFTSSKNNIFLGEEYNPNSVNDSKSIFLRLLKNFKFRPYYSLHRTKNLKKIFKIICKKKLQDWRSANFIWNIGSIILGQLYLFKECALIRWAGNKYGGNDHPVYLGYKNRYDWFLKNIIINFGDLYSVFNLNKSFHLNTTSFKIIFFLFDIIPSIIFKVKTLVKRKFLTILKKIGLNIKVRKIFKISQINSIFKFLNQNQT